MRGFPYDRFVAFLERRSTAILVAAAVLFAASALSLLRLQLDMDLLGQLPSRSEVFRDWRKALEVFGARDTLILLLRGSRSDLGPFAAKLAPKLESIPGVVSVRWRADADAVREWIAANRWALLDAEGYDELERRLRPEAIVERVAGFRQALATPFASGAGRWIADDPFGSLELVGRSIERGYADRLLRPSEDGFVSAAGDRLLILVRPERPAVDTIFGERLLRAVDSAIAEVSTSRRPNVTVGKTGAYVYAVADRHVVKRDVGLYFLFAPLAVLAVFHLGVRSFRVLPFVAIPLVLSTVVTFALGLVVYETFNMISVAFAGIFFGLAVDASVYFYAVLQAQRGSGAWDRAALRSGVENTLREIGRANVVASLTTAAAFAVIGFSEFTGVSEIGVLTAAGMLLNVAGTFVLLPAMVFVWGPSAVPAAARDLGVAAAYGRAARALEHRSRAVFVVTFVLLLAAAAAATRLRIDTDFSHLRPSGGEGPAVEREIAEAFGRSESRGVVMHSAPDLGSALREAERATERLEAQRRKGLVQAYSSLTTFLPSEETVLRRLARFRELPRVESAAALRDALGRAGFDVSAFEPFLRGWLAPDGATFRMDDAARGPLAALVEQHVRRTEAETLLATWILPAPDVDLAALATRLEAELPGDPPVVSGRELAEAELGRIIRKELAGFVVWSFVLNLVLILAAERSLRRALVVLLPTLAALLGTVAIAATVGIALDPVNLVVLPLLIGLSVDETVYLVAHVRFAGDLGRGVVRGFPPLAVAVATTIVGFGSLAFSRLPALAGLGKLAAIALALAAASTLVLAPVLIPFLDPGRDAER